MDIKESCIEELKGVKAITFRGHPVIILRFDRSLDLYNEPINKYKVSYQYLNGVGWFDREELFLEGETCEIPSITFKNGSTVRFKSCFKDKDLTFVGMADKLTGMNNCVVIHDGNCIPAISSELTLKE